MALISNVQLFFKWLNSRGFLREFHNFRLRHEQKVSFLKDKGSILSAQNTATANARTGCTHLKGGTVGTQTDGDDRTQYAVIKHMFSWGETQVRCQRCGKTWKQGDEGYAEALKFPTRNSPSGAVRFANIDVTKVHKLLGTA